jgi:hypothetical protein
VGRFSGLDVGKKGGVNVSLKQLRGHLLLCVPNARPPFRDQTPSCTRALQPLVASTTFCVGVGGQWLHKIESSRVELHTIRVMNGHSLAIEMTLAHSAYNGSRLVAQKQAEAATRRTLRMSRHE